ncbi:MAG: LCP family protein [Eubacterium sp.]|nr:LCP family protein [Eubacterium sp.]
MSFRSSRNVSKKDTSLRRQQRVSSADRDTISGQDAYYDDRKYRPEQDACYDDSRYRSGNQSSHRKKKKKSGRRMGCLVPMLLLLFFIVVISFVLLNMTFSKVEKHKLDNSVITVNHQDKRMNRYQTIALFGVDSQDNVIGDRGSRSDSIIVVSIHKTTRKVKLMSIYRDTYVSIDGQYDKINAAYSYGGPEQAINTINRNLDLDITDFATVNFKALADAVDILGGIPLTITTEKELDNLNDYIGNMNKINGGNSPKFKDVGTYTFDGNQAVAYSRIRYMEGGDHARASHQRLVVEGILSKAKRQPWKLNKIIDQVLPQCKTSFSTGKFTRMAMGLAFYDIVDSQAYPFDSYDEKYNGVYYGFPTTVESNTIKAHEYLFGTEDYQPTEELLRISQKVENVTSAMGH